MIKAVLGIADDPMYLLGLSAMNVQKLQEGYPIVFNATELSLGQGSFIVLYGETYDAIVKLLRDNDIEVPDTYARDALFRAVGGTQDHRIYIVGLCASDIDLLQNNRAFHFSARCFDIEHGTFGIVYGATATQLADNDLPHVNREVN